MKDREFNIDDIVYINHEPEFYSVVGVIHDDKRLFISNNDMNTKEIEVHFNEVTTHWSKS